jgi:hypothetical protein
MSIFNICDIFNILKSNSLNAILAKFFFGTSILMASIDLNFFINMYIYSLIILVISTMIVVPIILYLNDLIKNKFNFTNTKFKYNTNIKKFNLLFILTPILNTILIVVFILAGIVITIFIFINTLILIYNKIFPNFKILTTKFEF